MEVSLGYYLSGVLVEPLTNSHISQKVEKRFGGYLFTIRLDKLKEALPSVIRSHEADALADAVVQKCLSEKLPEVQIKERAPIFSSYGTICNTVSCPIAMYRGFHGYWRNQVEIFAEDLIRLEGCSKKGAWRYKEFRHMNLSQLFACVLAHEVRHWIQDVTGWTKRSRWEALSERLWRRFFRIAPKLIPIVVSALTAFTTAVIAWQTFFAVSSAMDSNAAILFGVLTFLGAFNLSYFACTSHQKWNGSGNGRGRIYAVCRWIDRNYTRFVYRYYFIERDADTFGFAAVKDPRWLEVVSVEKVEKVEAAQVSKCTA